MRIFKLAVAVVGACAVVASPLVANAAPTPPDAVKSSDIAQLDLYTLTDVHGHIELVVDKKKNTPQEAGLEKVGCFLDDVRAKKPDSSFTLLGDNIGASPFTSGSLKDNPTIEALNVLKPVASTIGNHELDLGQEVFKQRVDGSNKEEYAQVTFPYLGANVDGLGQWTNDAGTTVPYLGDYKVWTAPESKVKVAFIGAIAEDVPYKLSPDATKGMKFHNPIEKINTLAAKIKSEGIAEVVVAMLDDDVKNNFPLMGQHVDAIMGGDTHVPYEFDAVDSKVKLTNAANPLLAGVASGSYTDNMGLISISYDKAAKKVVKADAKLIGAPVMAACDSAKSESAKAIKTIVDKAVQDSKVAGAKPIVEGVKAEFRRGVFAASAGENPDKGSNRGIESSLGDLVADAMRAQVVTHDGKPADIGVINAGGMREDLIPINGKITYADTFAVMPFSNEIGYVTITGANFVKALEQQWKTNLNSQNSRPMLKLGLSSNVRYTYDPTKPFGQRITSVMINDAPIDMDKKYVVGSVTFLLAGGDSFDALTTGGPAVTSGNLDRDKFNEYLKSLKPEDLKPRAAKSSIGITLDRNEVKNGESVKVSLRGLSFSEGPSITQKVTVSAGETSATVAVNNSLVEPNANNEKSIITTDGAGMATVEVPVKATCPAAGGPVRVPISVATDFATVVTANQGVNVKVNCDPVATGHDSQATAKADEAAPTSVKPTTAATQVSTSGQRLAHTGASVIALTIGGIALLILGGGVAIAARRRH
ncbi:bifunctional metallophosphatase/5'-nucleotidase [Trueperella pyogenes]|uniref:bifunctional metallophosphatase/5'-nucleotidase n=1 Tax=Trueperella pyogenes TaxID=1661 RepID=UPI00345C7039